MEYPPMERLIRLSEFWSWLPAFRAVAETQHLPTAAAALCLSVPALSRSIKLLERSLRRDLFERDGRHLRLNEEGKRFLSAVRNAMRFVDDGLRHVASGGASGSLHVSAGGAIGALILPVLCEVQVKRPDLSVHLHDHPAGAVNGLLLRGQIDVAFVSDPRPDEGLQVEEVGSLSRGIYCSTRHDLAGTGRVTLKAALRHPFVVPAPGENDFAEVEHWPPALDRRAGLRVTQLAFAIEACATGSLLAYLPDLTVGTAPNGAKLRRLPIDVAPPVPLYAVTRERLLPATPLEAIVSAVRARLAVRGGGHRQRPSDLTPPSRR